MCFSKGEILWRLIIKICLIKRSTEVIRTQWQNFLQDPRNNKVNYGLFWDSPEVICKSRNKYVDNSYPKKDFSEIKLIHLLPKQLFWIPIYHYPVTQSLLKFKTNKLWFCYCKLSVFWMLMYSVQHPLVNIFIPSWFVLLMYLVIVPTDRSSPSRFLCCGYYFVFWRNQ